MYAPYQLEKLRRSLRSHQQQVAARKEAIAEIERRIQGTVSRYDAIVARHWESNLAVGGSGGSLLTEDLELRKAVEIHPLKTALANYTQALQIEEKQLAEREVELAKAIAACRVADTTFTIARAIPQNITESVRAVATEVDPAFLRLFHARQSQKTALARLARAQRVLKPICALERHRSGLSGTLSTQQKRRSRIVDRIKQYRQNLKVLDEQLVRTLLPSRIVELTDSRYRIAQWVGDRTADLQSLDRAIAQVRQQLSDVDATLKAQKQVKRKALADIKQAQHSLEIFQSIVEREESRSPYFASLKLANPEDDASAHPPAVPRDPFLLNTSGVSPVAMPVRLCEQEPVAIASNSQPLPPSSPQQVPLPSPNPKPQLNFDEMRKLAKAFGGRAKIILASQRFSHPRQTLSEYHFEFRDFKSSRQFFDTIHGRGKYGRILHSEYTFLMKGTRLFTRAIKPSDGYQYIVRSPMQEIQVAAHLHKNS